MLESIRKVDDFGLNLELQNLSHQIQSSLEKMRLGFAYKSPVGKESNTKDRIQFSEILNSDDDTNKSFSSLDTISDQSGDSRMQQKAKNFIRRGKKHFTNKFTETVQPFLPQSGLELLNLFLSRFPNSRKEGEIWSELVKKVDY